MVTQWVLINTGFVAPSNTSGGIDLPNLGIFSGGLPIGFLLYSGQTSTGPGAVYGMSGYTYLSGNASPREMYIGQIPVLNNPYSATGQNAGLGNPITPFTDTSQIKVCITPTNSGMTLVYGGFI